jgi:hypothetical protein
VEGCRPYRRNRAPTACQPLTWLKEDNQPWKFLWLSEFTFQSPHRVFCSGVLAFWHLIVFGQHETPKGDYAGEGEWGWSIPQTSFT